jgi:hypothetical protein
MRLRVKGNEKLIAVLNDLLADELTAINQYMVHSEMCDDWGYEKLHKHFEKRAIDEMKHAEKLIGRILFLEGLPMVSNLKKISIGSTVASSSPTITPPSRTPSAPTTRRLYWPGRSRTTRARFSAGHTQRRGCAHGRHRGPPEPDRADDDAGLPDDAVEE